MNELTRRFEVLDANIEIDEKVQIVNHYTQQLLNSGYSNDQIKDIIISGLKGAQRKEERRKVAMKRYRSSHETLEERERKKLTEATNWYRDKKKEEIEDKDTFKLTSFNDKMDWLNKKKGKRKGGKRKDLKRIEINGKEKLMSVIFVPHTNRSELAKRWRERLEVFEKIGSIKLKVVERTGRKLVDLLHKSNVWSDQDCQRQDCILCKSCTEEEKKGRCKSRNVIYETYCETCEDKIVKEKKLRNIEVSQRGKNDKIEEVEITDEKEKKRKGKENEKKSIGKKDIEKKEYSVKYVGETGRSAYERGKEHVEDFYNLSEKSHLLKHYILEHQKEIKMQDLMFGMRVREVFNTAIERQVRAAVAISIEQRK